MRILVVCSGNAVNFSLEKNQAFIYDQIKSIEKLDAQIQFKVFALKGKGIGGYLKQLKQLKAEIADFRPNLIHAHGGHVGLLCVLQRKVPVVVTFHGSDVNVLKNKLISTFASIFSSYSIFVSEQLRAKMNLKGFKSAVVPCGVDRSIFQPMESKEAKRLMGFEEQQKYILFTSSFDNTVKNYPLAKAVIDNFPDYRLQEIKNKTREEVNLLINGAEMLIMTSISEGSPQIIKEALACNQRIVSVSVGDVAEQLQGVDNCRVCEADVNELVMAVKEVLAVKSSDEGRNASERFDSVKIAREIVGIYISL